MGNRLIPKENANVMTLQGGYVKARCEARQLVPKAERKADFAAILK